VLAAISGLGRIGQRTDPGRQVADIGAWLGANDRRHDEAIIDDADVI
jgi:hypothetical protein